MKVIYFDNAATSNFKPKSVRKAFLKSLKRSANAGRSGHKLAIENSFLVYSSREKVANHFNIENPENIIFTKNCTEALNIAILGTVKIGGNVVCSTFEHNSVLRPLFTLQNEGKITLKIITPQNGQFITKNDVEKAINNKTYLVCVNSISNVTGNKNDVEQIAEFCKQKNILYLCDCAQSCGHLKFNLKKTKISFLTFAGHKGFLSPQGIGGLVINTSTLPKPIMYGGTGSESQNTFQPENLPDRLESGTLSCPLISSLEKGVSFVEKHFEKNNEKVEKLTYYLLTELYRIKHIKVYTLKGSLFGVVAFEIKNIDSNTVADFLNEKYNIAVRGGLHCAPLCHSFLGTTKNGLVRVSLNFRNNKKEIDVLIKALKEIIEQNK